MLIQCSTKLMFACFHVTLCKPVIVYLHNADTNCARDSVPCRNTPGVCIPAFQVCNNQADCSDGTDELFCGE